MRPSVVEALARTTGRLAIAVIVAMWTMPAPAAAYLSSATSITIANSSRWQIRGVYLTPPGQNLWGDDQLNGVVINSGESFTLGNVLCNGTSIEVVTEDRAGCFLHQILGCTGGATWVITDDATPDCGK